MPEFIFWESYLKSHIAVLTLRKKPTGTWLERAIRPRICLRSSTRPQRETSDALSGWRYLAQNISAPVTGTDACRVSVNNKKKKKLGLAFFFPVIIFRTCSPACACVRVFPHGDITIILYRSHCLITPESCSDVFTSWY